MRGVDLCSGAGGLALGLHLAGFDLELLVDSDEVACETLRHNANRDVSGTRGWGIVHDLMENVDLGSYSDIDLLAAGIPCQPYSRGGNKNGHEDERNLFPQFSKALAITRPRAFLLENSDALATAQNGEFEFVRLQLSYPDHKPVEGEHWTRHAQTLQHLAASDRRPVYRVFHKVLEAANFDVPQRRRRVFLVGFRSDQSVEWQFPSGTRSRDALIRDQWITGDYWLRMGARRDLSLRPSKTTLEKAEDIPKPRKDAWQTLREAICDLKFSSCLASQHQYIPGARSYPGHTGSPQDRPAKTLKAGVHGVPGGENMIANLNGSVRYLTIREAARVQTFPDTWEFTGARSQVTRQLGNAVPVNLAKVLGQAIFETISVR